MRETKSLIRYNSHGRVSIVVWRIKHNEGYNKIIEMHWPIERIQMISVSPART